MGLVLLVDFGGAARLLAELGRRQRERWGHWLTAGTPQTALAVRLFGAAFVLLARHRDVSAELTVGAGAWTDQGSAVRDV